MTFVWRSRRCRHGSKKFSRAKRPPRRRQESRIRMPNDEPEIGQRAASLAEVTGRLRVLRWKEQRLPKGCNYRKEKSVTSGLRNWGLRLQRAGRSAAEMTSERRSAVEEWRRLTKRASNGATQCSRLALSHEYCLCRTMALNSGSQMSGIDFVARDS